MSKCCWCRRNFTRFPLVEGGWELWVGLKIKMRKRVDMWLGLSFYSSIMIRLKVILCRSESILLNVEPCVSIVLTWFTILLTPALTPSELPSRPSSHSQWAPFPAVLQSWVVISIQSWAVISIHSWANFLLPPFLIDTFGYNLTVFSHSDCKSKWLGIKISVPPNHTPTR